VKIAVDESLTYGEALGRLTPYRALVQSWQLPDALPPSLKDTAPSSLVREYFEALEVGGVGESTKLLYNALRVSARRQTALDGVVQEMAPLLRLVPCDLDRLLQVAAGRPQVVSFDDLLILGTQQLTPPVDRVDEIVAMCKPFARDEGCLLDLVSRWRPVLAELTRSAES
jgi:hypothetical protein